MWKAYGRELMIDLMWNLFIQQNTDISSLFSTKLCAGSIYGYQYTPSDPRNRQIVWRSIRISLFVLNYHIELIRHNLQFKYHW